MKKLLAVILCASLLLSVSGVASASWAEPWTGGSDLRTATDAHPSVGFPTKDHPAPHLIQKEAKELPVVRIDVIAALREQFIDLVIAAAIQYPSGTIHYGYEFFQRIIYFSDYSLPELRALIKSIQEQYDAQFAASVGISLMAYYYALIESWSD